MLHGGTPAASSPQDRMALTELLAGGDELSRRLRVEGKHFVVTGDHAPHTGLTGQASGFITPHVTSHPPLWTPSVDGQYRRINGPLLQLVRQPVIHQRITAMVNSPRTELDHITQEEMPALLIPLDTLMG